MNHLLNLWDIVTWVVMPFTFLATIRLSLQGMVKFPGRGIVRVLSHEGWCISIITVIPWHISAFARGEISPLPWQLFSGISAIHGAAEGCIAMLIVCIVVMWLLWTPAQMYAHRIHPSDRNTVKFVRIINVLAGLLLLTPNNPFFNLAQLF
jgi:hypothetical protein